MDDSIREAIVHSYVTDLSASGVIVGAVDRVPESMEEYETPPKPSRRAWGRSGFPFSFVFELPETMDVASPDSYNVTLYVRVETVFRYNRAKGAEHGLETVGRKLLADIQQILHVDEHRGTNPTHGGGNVHSFREISNGIDKIPGTSTSGLGVVTTDFSNGYFRNMKDPRSRIPPSV